MKTPTSGCPGTGSLTRKSSLTAICLVMVLIWGALPALAQPDRHDQQDEQASPGALAQYRKGERLAKNGQLSEAIAAYRQAISLEPAFVQAYYEMGLAYAGLKQYPDAVRAFQAGRPPATRNGPGL